MKWSQNTTKNSKGEGGTMDLQIERNKELQHFLDMISCMVTWDLRNISTWFFGSH